MNKRAYYENHFASFPDVVILQQFRMMLGGISEKAAYRLIRGHHVQHYYVRKSYMIPKVWVIDYVLSEHYAEYSKMLKARV